MKEYSDKSVDRERDTVVEKHSVAEQDVILNKNINHTPGWAGRWSSSGCADIFSDWWVSHWRSEPLKQTCIVMYSTKDKFI